MREEIAIIIQALMLSILSQSTKRMSDEKRDKLLVDTADWAVNEIMKVIQGNTHESSDTPVAG